MDDYSGIRAWLRTCPYLSATSPFMIDYLDDDPDCYAIYAVPTTIKYKRDILGNVWPDAVQERNYYFNATLEASRDSALMAANQEILSNVIYWMQDQNLAGNLPEISGHKVLALVPTLSPYAQMPNSNAMNYRISLNMKIRKEPTGNG